MANLRMGSGMLGFSTNSIYGILDAEVCLENGLNFRDAAVAALHGGIRILQYRDKISPREEICSRLEILLPAAGKAGALLILNDHLDIAEEFSIPAHLGQNDGRGPVSMLTMGFEEETDPRADFESRILFGRSTHSPEQVKSALEENPKPDYIGFGPVFQSMVKGNKETVMDRIGEVIDIWPDAIVFIGGINRENLRALPASSRYYYAVISDLFAHSELSAVEKAARELVSLAG